MTDRTSEDIEVGRDGLTLRGLVERPQDSEHGPAVIFMHGFMRDMGAKEGDVYQQIADGLVDQGFTVVRFDFNGRGGSDGDFADSDVFNQIEDAIAVLDYVRTRIQPTEISLMGHSQGGVIAGMTAGMYSDVVNNLVMLAPAATIKDDALRGTLLGVPFDANHVPDEITLRNGRTVAGKYVRIAQTLPIYETTAMFKGPALAIQGEDDAVIGDGAVRQYGAAMPNCAVGLYTNLGHPFTGEDRDAAIAEAVQFLASHKRIV